jgi:hypothetical protein
MYFCLVQLIAAYFDFGRDFLAAGFVADFAPAVFNF